MFDQRAQDIKFVIKTLNDAKAIVVKASKQAKAMDINHDNINQAATILEKAADEIKQLLK